jgi:hypothetical protein
MRRASGGKMQWALVAATVFGGCAERPAISARDSLIDPLRAGIVIDLDVRGGPQAGRYHVETMQGSCRRRTSGRGSWAIRYAKEGASPSGLQLTIADATAAERGTGEIGLAVTFGTDVLRGSGNGTVRLQGVGAVVRVDGRAEDGVRLRATIRCNDVLRVPGMDGG